MDVVSKHEPDATVGYAGEEYFHQNNGSLQLFCSHLKRLPFDIQVLTDDEARSDGNIIYES